MWFPPRVENVHGGSRTHVKSRPVSFFTQLIVIRLITTFRFRSHSFPIYSIRTHYVIAGSLYSGRFHVLSTLPFLSSFPSLSHCVHIA